LMKNKGLIITLIFFLVVIIIGLISFLFLVLNGKFNIVNGFKICNMRKSSNIIFEQNYKLDTIENLEILSNAGDISFKENTDNNIKVIAYGQDNKELKVTLEEKKLKIDYSEYKNMNTGFSFYNYSNDIIIYIPKEYSKDININSKYGDINIIDLENASINIIQDCGDVNIEKINIANISSKYGDVNVGTIYNKFAIDSNCGDVKIDKIDIKEDSSIKSDYGDIKIKEVNDIYVDAKTDFGDVEVNKSNRMSEITLNLKNDCGDIKVGNK